MKIIEIRALKGPNYYSKHPVIFMKLDLKELEMKPTDLIVDFKNNIHSMMPSLYEHTCSPGSVGGFYERLISGTWAGHVVEHVAIELQYLAGHKVTFGKTFTTNEKGIYKLVYRYLDEDTGLRAGELAVDIVEKLFKGTLTNIKPLIKELQQIADSNFLGPSTQSIVTEANKRGIPHIRLNDQSYIQLGLGVYQRRIEATLMDNTSILGVEIAGNKARTKSLLSAMGIPVSKGQSVYTIEEALDAAETIQYPVVIKPLSGNHGRGITINITGPEELPKAFKTAQKISDTIVVEKHLDGFDFRLLVINGELVAAARREPAYVIGNGTDTIQELIEKVNNDPNRGVGHEKNLTKITIDYMTERLLSTQELTLKSILDKDKKIYVKSTGNLSAGATAKDVTDTVHPLNRSMAQRISQIVGLNVMGIDIIADSLEKPLSDENSGVIEVNAAPGFRMHLHPTIGKQRNIAAHIVDMLFPVDSKHSVPIVAVTGTNGKTTTVRLINHILQTNGNTVGMTSTHAVSIDNIPIIAGDYSGPQGARTVLMDSSIDHAVLEIARGGILRRGLGFAECDVGILLNISADHLGEGGISTLEELTRLKSTVTEAVKPSGYAIFNADDPLVLSCLNKTKGSPILFSKNQKNKALKENYKQGNLNVLLIDNKIISQTKGKTTTIASVKEIPITFNGKAGFNVENVLAAVAAAIALGLNKAQIKKGLMSFKPSIDQSYGRMNLIDMNEFKVLIDYGHNPGAINATGDFINKLMPGRKIRMAFAVGNRNKEDIFKLGVALSKYYDHIVLYDPESRSREIGETADIIKQGLIDAGFKETMITTILDETKATHATLDMAKKGDLVVLQADDIDQIISDVFDYKKNHLKLTQLSSSQLKEKSAKNLEIGLVSANPIKLK